MNEIKLGRQFHYKLDSKSGFWVSQVPTDPMSATITSGELSSILVDHIAYGRDLVAKMNARLDEWQTFVDGNSYEQAKD